MLKLSIIVNMYNTAVYMPKCIDTLLHQDLSMTDYEIILVNDGSPDNSLEMANDYASRFSNIKVCSHANKGLAGARNTGLDAAEGQYVCWVDPDDYVEPNSFCALLNQMDAEQLDILRFRYQNVDEHYNLMPDYEHEAHFDYTPGLITGRDFLTQRLGIQCYVWPYIYRLQFLRDTGIRFIEGCYLDDTPWLPRVLLAAKRMNCVDWRRHYYLQRSTSMVRISSPAGLKRKMDGQWMLWNILKEQYAQQTYPEVKEWYRMMRSHTAFGILNLTATYHYSACSAAIRQLKADDAFPLSLRMASHKSLRKFRLINLCPLLFCWLIHILHGK